MPCWLFTVTSSMRKALWSWTKLSCNETTRESIIMCHLWLLYHMSLHLWGLVTWAVAYIQCIPGPQQPGWRRKSLGCLGNFSAPSLTPISETNQNCMPQHQHLSPRQGQICLTMGRQQIHSRQVMMFKNACSLQLCKRGRFLDCLWSTANLFPSRFLLNFIGHSL